MGLGNVIRRCRQQRDLTQDRLAARVGISKPYLSNIETGRVKNPPSDGVVRRLEKALGFAEGELMKLAHLERTPLEVRVEHEELSAEVVKLRDVLSRLAAGRPPAKRAARRGAARGGAVNLDAVLRKLSRDKGGVSETITAGAAIPVINRVAAGYPHEFTDLDYPVSVADEYVRCPDVHDPNAFAARVVGDSMAPKYSEGDIIIFSPGRQPDSGDDVFARLEGGETTFKRFYIEKGRKIRLQPLNDKYPPQVYDAESVTGLWPAVMRIQRLR